MDSNYDEDITQNPFFQELKTEQKDLFHRATVEGWIICVPRCGTIQRATLTPDDLLSHILIPSDELPETHFRTINGKDIRVYNRVLTVDNGDISSTNIVFEETFYTEDYSKYKVWCIESPLEQTDSVENDSCIHSVFTLWDCIDLLWTESLGKQFLENLDCAIKLFLQENPPFESCSLQTQKDLFECLYKQCIKIVFQESRIREKSSRSKHLHDNIKISVETYIQHEIYKHLFKGISARTSLQDSQFNKIVRNLSDIQLRDIDVNAALYDAVPCAKQTLAKISQYSTNLGKIGCLRHTVSIITKRKSKYDQTGVFLSSDELLPLIVFLIIKTGLPNWIAQLTFMKEFRFSFTPADESCFLITTLEAAIEHIRSGYIYSLQNSEDIDSIQSNSKTVENLFKQVRLEDIDAVKVLLEQTEKNGVEKISKTCHPLCSCDKCESLFSQNVSDISLTVQSCDDRGFTALHVACFHGKPKMVEFLIQYRANINAKDYSEVTPLHYAAQRGHQNVLLLLLHNNADMNAMNYEGNTPLHFAGNNGHEGCIKAILYYAEQCRFKLNINAVNNLGDTALHCASRWGYEGIVKILLDYGARSDIGNKRKLTAIDCALSLHISQIIHDHCIENEFEIIPITDIVKKKSEDSLLDFTETDSQCSSGTSRKSSVCSLQGLRPQSTKQIKKVESLLRAIVFGDMNLTCFYLGIPLSTTKPSDSITKPQCHPLCVCEKCNPDLQTSEEKEERTCDDILSVNVCNSDGFTPLHISVMYGWSKITRLLLDSGANINVITKTKNITPLHLACQNRRTAVIRQLIQSGNCNLDIKDYRGNTALHYACALGDTKLAEVLVANGANIHIKNSDGKTPLDEAEEKMMIGLVKLLKC